MVRQVPSKVPYTGSNPVRASTLCPSGGTGIHSGL